MIDTCKATITYGDVKIVLEGPKDFIDEQIAKYTPRSNAPIKARTVASSC